MLRSSVVRSRQSSGILVSASSSSSDALLRAPMLEKGSAAAKLRQTEPVAIDKSNSQYPEIAVLGRSNAGKSSLVNLLTWRSNLAPVSNTPGKTQQPNRFAMHPVKGSTWLLVDLPGYGFAKVPSGVSNK